ncbi:hypothetical protein QE152_g35750 [Popillia japonica]|uniref:Uncharacterized protein n=1 Tax=Popillia japonica TaxID=7064 RepID=A0AAW1IEZ1_POPJA
MESKNFVSNNTQAELNQSWHIPRPTLARSSKSSQGSTSSNNSTQSAKSGSLLLTAANLAQIMLQSAKSGSLLLTAANLAQIHAENVQKETTCTTKEENLRYYLEQTGQRTKEENLRYYLEQTGQSNPLFSLSSENIKKPDPDTVSVASSMHFTVVNVDTRPPVKPRSFCRKHQLTVLVVTMSALFTIGILAAIVLLEMRARRQQY